LEFNALRKDLRASTAEGTATSVMVGIGETYLPAFVLAVSANQLACGLVSTVPLLAGAVLQLVSPRMVRRHRSYRRWVVCCAAIQAAAFVPLLCGAMWGFIPVMAVFGLATVYWAGGMASGAAWNAWVETLVPQRLQARYFARRALVSQWGVMAGFVAGGMVLHAAAGGGNHVRAFAVLFLVAAAARFCSAALLRRQREPQPPGNRLPLPPLGKLTAALVRDTNGPVLAYLLLSQAAVQVASPYFTPFMLGHLALGYYRYVVLICTALLARIVLLPAWGRVVERCGPHRVLWLSALGIVPLPALWVLSQSFAVLVVAGRRGVGGL
jgi:MFS family permease